MKNILKVINLKTIILTNYGQVNSTRGISFEINENEIIGLVGESGSGKSITAHTLLRLLPTYGKVTNGQIIYKGENILTFSQSNLRKYRGKEVSIIFQDPLTSLNPVIKIGDQITETILAHNKISKKEAKYKSLDLLNEVGIPDSIIRYNNYPHQLSGGMRQRITIAIALSCNPSLLIADEPTTSLDVTVQAQIFRLLLSLQKKYKMSILIITHDLGIISEITKRLLIMYSGKIVEEGDTDEIFKNPMHPYTKALINCRPKLKGKIKSNMQVIGGTIPNLINIDSKCSFYERCINQNKKCINEPELIATKNKKHKVSCWYTN